MSEPVRSIDETLKEELKTAMKAKDQPTLDVVRMVKSKMLERLKDPDAPKEVTDDLWRDVINAYVKSMEKAAEEFRKVGERGAENLAKLEAEVKYLRRYLPEQLSGAALEDAVRKAIATSGATSAKDMGKVMGAVMKDHKGKVDGNAVREVATRLLASG